MHRCTGIPTLRSTGRVRLRNGAASSDLELYIGAGRGEPGDQRAVTVLQSTGRASWYRYAAAGWKEASL